MDPQLISRARGHLKDILRQEQIERAFSEIPAAQCIEPKSEHGEIATVTGDSGEAASDVVEAKQEITTEKDTCMKMKDEDVFTNSMPLSFRFWKPSVQGQGTASRAIGKAAVGYVSVTFV